VGGGGSPVILVQLESGASTAKLCEAKPDLCGLHTPFPATNRVGAPTSRQPPTPSSAVAVVVATTAAATTSASTAANRRRRSSSVVGVADDATALRMRQFQNVAPLRVAVILGYSEIVQLLLDCRAHPTRRLDTVAANGTGGGDTTYYNGTGSDNDDDDGEVVCELVEVEEEVVRRVTTYDDADGDGEKRYGKRNVLHDLCKAQFLQASPSPWPSGALGGCVSSSEERLSSGAVANRNALSGSAPEQRQALLALTVAVASDVSRSHLLYSQDEHGRLPLHYASATGNQAMVQFLLEQMVAARSLPPDVSNPRGDNQADQPRGGGGGRNLARSASYLPMDFFRESKEKSSISINHLFVDQGGWTPLSLAVYHGHASIVKVLLSPDFVKGSSALKGCLTHDMRTKPKQALHKTYHQVPNAYDVCLLRSFHCKFAKQLTKAQEAMVSKHDREQQQHLHSSSSPVNSGGETVDGGLTGANTLAKKRVSVVLDVFGGGGADSGGNADAKLSVNTGNGDGGDDQEEKQKNANGEGGGARLVRSKKDLEMNEQLVGVIVSAVVENEAVQKMQDEFVSSYIRREGLRYALFVLVLLLTSLWHRNMFHGTKTYFEQQTVAIGLAGDFQTVTDVDSLWSYLLDDDGGLAGSLWGDQAGSGDGGVLNGDLRVVGAVRLRQLRAKVDKKACRALSPILKNSAETCYSTSELTKTKSLGYYKESPGFFEFDWGFDFGFYPQDQGTVLDLPNGDKDGAVRLLEAAMLGSSGLWSVDEQTRAVAIDFTVYNWQLDVATSTHVFFEFLSTGSVYSTAYAYAMRLPGGISSSSDDDDDGGGSGGTLAGLVLDVCLSLLTVHLFLVEAYELVRDPKMYYVERWANARDTLVVGLLTLWMGLRITVFSLLSNAMGENGGQGVDASEFVFHDEFYRAGYLSSVANYLLGFLVLVALLGTSKYLWLDRTFGPWTQACIKAFLSDQVLHFGALYLWFVLIFAVSIFVMFGGDAEEYSSFLETCIRSLIAFAKLGAGEYATLTTTSSLVGTVMFLGLLLFGNILLQGIFTAVIIQAYKDENKNALARWNEDVNELVAKSRWQKRYNAGGNGTHYEPFDRIVHRDRTTLMERVVKLVENYRKSGWRPQQGMAEGGEESSPTETYVRGGAILVNWGDHTAGHGTGGFVEACRECIATASPNPNEPAANAVHFDHEPLAMNQAELERLFRFSSHAIPPISKDVLNQEAAAK